MANLIQKLMEGARNYTILDFGMLKFALLFLGILLGTYFQDFFEQYLWIIWTLTIISYVYIVAVTLRGAFRKRR